MSDNNKSVDVPTAFRLFILRRRHSDRMNRLQEWANAVTQLSPALCFLYYVTVSHGAVSIPCWVLIISVWVHLPFSFYYHVQCAMRNDDCDFDPVRCLARRLDSTFIHLSAVCVSFGTSHGSLYYAGVCSAFNLSAAALHWGKDVNISRNQRNILIAILLYIAPLVWRNDVKNLTGALLGFIPAGFIFSTYVFGGYSHAIFHLFMGVFAYFILQSAMQDGLRYPGVSAPASATFTATMAESARH